MKLSKPLAVAAVCATVVAVGAGSAVAGGLITGAQIKHGTITGANIHSATIPASKLTAGARKSLKGATGARGPAGKNGVSATPSVQTFAALTHLTNREDSGDHGNWAVDTIDRTATITLEGSVPVSNCAPGAVRCWFYTASITDAGTFQTPAGGALSPSAGVPISGVVNGTIQGEDQFEIYASSDAPSPGLVPSHLDGNDQSTSSWFNQFFPGSVSVVTANEYAWSWTYNAPSTCETWVDASTGETGDITGVNACP